ncbi:MAG: tetratricopeptide repeat protein [Ignavibacteria bacterium]|nr:tetratricopeptide repeat protein [Ignavibacteria bacterium]
MSKKTEKSLIKKQTASSGNNVLYIILAALSIIFIFICLNNKFVQDDAFISFRYVQNFVDGYGLVFNIGERVEGYTNLLWVLLLSVFAFFKINLQSISQILSVLFGTLVLIMTFKVSQLIELKDETKLIKKIKTSDTDTNVNYFNLIPSVMLVFTGSFIFWSISGMESTMFISFCLLGIYYYLKESSGENISYKFPLFIFLATLTRPEGLYFFGLIILHKVFFTFLEHRSNAFKILFSRKNLISYSVYIIPVILYFLIRYMYYGYLFPNTYYAKTGLSTDYLNSGIEYFIKFLKAYMLYGVLLLAPLYLLRRKENIFAVSLFYLIIISFILYVISVGGDVLKQNRFFLPVLPLIYILFAKFLTDIYYLLKGKNGNSGIAFPAVIIITAAICFFYYTSQKETLDKDIQSENGLVDKMKIAGSWFKSKQQQLRRPLNLAATTIGSVSYFAGSEVNVIDLLGLTDKEIAHNPQIIPEISNQSIGWKERNYNAGYVMDRKPDYVYFSTGVKPSAYAERALYTTPDFNKYYFPYYFTDKANNFTDVVYKRKSEDEVKDVKFDFPGNPNYKHSFVNMFNQAMNSSKDKSRSQIAINEFKQSIENGPSNFGLPFLYIGDIYLQSGNKEQAIESYKKAVEINEYNILANYQLYQLLSEKGDTLNAKNYLQKIQKYDPEILR